MLNLIGQIQKCIPLHRVRFLLGGRHGDFKFLPPPGYAPCYEAVLPRDRLRIEPIKEYKHDFNDVRNLLGPTQSLSHTAFTPCPVDTVQVGFQRIQLKVCVNKVTFCIDFAI